MRSLHFVLAVAASAFALGPGNAAHAQCLDWKPGFGPAGGGANLALRAFAVFDDGSGPALYAGGDFTAIGGSTASGVAKWDGTDWVKLGTEPFVSNSYPYELIFALAVFDDGNGPALYAAGSFSSVGGVAARNIAKWDGASWSALGAGLGSTNDFMYAMTVFDDGSGAKLYVGGNFIQSGEQWLNHLAAWDGASWTQVGPGTDTAPRVMTVFDAGSGPALYLGVSGGILRWDGAQLTGVASTNGLLHAMEVVDDGNGPALFLGGTFTTVASVSANRIARYDGANWSALGAGTDGDVDAITAFDDGTGPALYAGGSFSNAGGGAAQRIARWDGASWQPLGSGVGGQGTTSVRALAEFGAELFVGGTFTLAGGKVANNLARWNGSGWMTGTGEGLDSGVPALAVFDDGSGPALYAGGTFSHAGGLPAERIARWNGTSWSALGSGVGTDGFGAPQSILALLAFDDGSGNALYVGGGFDVAGGLPVTNIARWDGTSWSSVGTGISALGAVHALCIFDDGSGPALYAAGNFTQAGGAPARSIARWDGASWSALGAGLTYGGGFGTGTVKDLAVFDDGSGPALYVGGGFSEAGGVSAWNIARWDGTTWSGVGGGVSGGTGDVYCLDVFDDGSGAALYAGGEFVVANGAAGNYIARWNGSTWSALPSEVNFRVFDFEVFDDGSGAALFVGGSFTLAGGEPARGIAKWDGTTWTELDRGLDGNHPVSGGVFTNVLALEVFDDGLGGGPDLWVGGMFTGAGDHASWNSAQWRGCAGPGTMFCFGDGSDGACPCGNDGMPQRGCDNSGGTGGALLTSHGQTNPDSVVLVAIHELPNALTIFLQGNLEIAPTPFGDGLRCAGGGLLRLYAKQASGGVVFAPAGGDPSISDVSAALGDPLGSGDVRIYQTYYRDPISSFCAPNNWNAANAVRIAW